MLHLTNSPKHFVSLPPPSIPFPPPSFLDPLEETLAHLEEPPGQLHSILDCDSCSRIRDSVAILHDLVFVVKKDVDDLHFRLEHMDKQRDKIESLLTTLLNSLHSPKLATRALTTSKEIFSPTIQVDAECDVGKSDRQIE